MLQWSGKSKTLYYATYGARLRSRYAVDRTLAKHTVLSRAILPWRGYFGVQAILADGARQLRGYVPKIFTISSNLIDILLFIGFCDYFAHGIVHRVARTCFLKSCFRVSYRLALGLGLVQLSNIFCKVVKYFYLYV